MKDMIRCDSGAQRPDRIEELCEWVRSLGVEPNNVRSEFAIVMGESSYELHLSEYVRDEHGKQIVDVAANDTVSKPLIVDLGMSECWPSWLNEMRERPVAMRWVQPSSAQSEAFHEAMHRAADATRIAHL